MEDTKKQEQENEKNEGQEITEEEFDFEDNQNEIISDNYEICYIIPSSYTVDETKPIDEQVKKLITEHNGQINKEDDLGKLKFAYPIKNISHGYYHLLEFDMPRKNLQKLNSALRLTSEVLRFIIVKKKIKTAKEIKQEQELQEKLAKKKEQDIEKIKEEKKEEKEKPAKKEGKEGKISIEDLDKKLDEILDTDEML